MRIEQNVNLIQMCNGSLIGKITDSFSYATFYLVGCCFKFFFVGSFLLHSFLDQPPYVHAYAASICFFFRPWMCPIDQNERIIRDCVGSSVDESILMRVMNVLPFFSLLSIHNVWIERW